MKFADPVGGVFADATCISVVLRFLVFPKGSIPAGRLRHVLLHVRLRAWSIDFSNAATLSCSSHGGPHFSTSCSGQGAVRVRLHCVGNGERRRLQGCMLPHSLNKGMCAPGRGLRRDVADGT